MFNRTELNLKTLTDIPINRSVILEKNWSNYLGVGGGGGGILSFIKCPVHHSIHGPLFLRKIVGIEDFAYTGGHLG